MEREAFSIKELIDKLELDEDDIIYGIEDIPGYKPIESENLYIDLEKGYTKRRVIFKRNTDNKYFKVKYEVSVKDSMGWSECNWQDTTEAVEVFPKEVTAVIYE